jgi:hypothetical protein
VKNNFRAVIAVGMVMSGFALHLFSQAQIAPSASEGVTSSPEANPATQPANGTQLHALEQEGQPMDPHPAAKTANVADSAEPPSPQSPAPVAAPTFPASPVKPPPGFFNRLGWAYLADWMGITPRTPTHPSAEAPIRQFHRRPIRHLTGRSAEHRRSALPTIRVIRCKRPSTAILSG